MSQYNKYLPVMFYCIITYFLKFKLHLRKSLTSAQEHLFCTQTKKLWGEETAGPLLIQSQKAKWKK